MRVLILKLTMKTPLIFNPQGDDTNRSIWFGNTTNVINLNSVKYPWAIDIYNQMQENFWIPQKIDITQDVTDYNNLLPQEERAFDLILSFLTFLDSIQTINIPHLKIPITAPELHVCLAQQDFQEALHVQSYQYIIETIIPKEKRNYIYELWRDDAILHDRCNAIAKLFQKYVDSKTEYDYFIALFADYLLEGIYFYQGFIFFYSLASRHLMSGCADIFKYINRDELSHLRLYQRLMVEAMKVFNYSANQLYEIVENVVSQEINWSNHAIQNVLGITPNSIESYTKYLANVRLRAIGLAELYPGFSKSPYSHLERFADTKGEGNTKGNFFEATVTSYNMATAVSGWDW